MAMTWCGWGCGTASDLGGQGGFPRENGVQMRPEGWRRIHQRSCFVKAHRGEEKLHVAGYGWWIWKEIRTKWWGVLETLLHGFILHSGTTGRYWSMSIEEWHEQISSRIQRMGVGGEGQGWQQGHHREDVTGLNRQRLIWPRKRQEKWMEKNRQI